MKKIGESLPSGRSLSLPPNSAMAKRGPLPKVMPPVMNQQTDVDIPRSAWAPWIPSNGPRKLVRPLTGQERWALESRRDQLAPWVAGFEGREEGNAVALAIADMLSAFRSMRQLDHGAIAQIDSIKRVLSTFPLWAIEKACLWIQQNGVWRDGKFDRQWPPNDAEIVEEVRQKLRLYSDQYRSAVELLEASVEEEA
jgi:hypothetical protein